MPDLERVLVTGGNGFLGANIVRELVSRGCHPVLLLRKESNRLALQHVEYEVIEGELHNLRDLDRAIEGCRYVIHCAAKTGQKGALEDYKSVNTEPVRLFVPLCKKYAVKRFLYISTANCFTNGNIEHPGTEVSGFMPWLRKSGYAYSKYLAQEFLLNEFHVNGFPVIILAPTFLIGPGDAKRSSGKLFLHGINGRVIFYPPGGKSFVDVEHAANATVNALTDGKTGNCYLLAGENLSYRQFFMFIKRNYNPHAVLIKIPNCAIQPITVIAEIIQRLFKRSIILNKTNWRLLSLDNYFSNRKAKNELNMKDTNIQDAMGKSYTWFLKYNYIRNKHR